MLNEGKRILYFNIATSMLKWVSLHNHFLCRCLLLLQTSLRTNWAEQTAYRGKKLYDLLSIDLEQGALAIIEFDPSLQRFMMRCAFYSWARILQPTKSQEDELATNNGKNQIMFLKSGFGCTSHGRKAVLFLFCGCALVSLGCCRTFTVDCNVFVCARAKILCSSNELMHSRRIHVQRCVWLNR